MSETVIISIFIRQFNKDNKKLSLFNDRVARIFLNPRPFSPFSQFISSGSPYFLFLMPSSLQLSVGFYCFALVSASSI